MTSKTLLLSEDGRRLSYREAGHGAPLVLIHGVGMQSAAWAPQLRALSDSYRVLALDMPGHGGSSPLPAEADLPAFVAWLDEALSALALGPVSLAGHSMGALVSGGYAVTHPDRVARVALLNGVFRRAPAARAAVEARATEIRCGTIDIAAPLARWFGDDRDHEAARRAVAGWLGEVSHTGYATAYGAFSRGDDVYADRLGAFRGPLLALTGDLDPNSTPEMARAMAGAAPHGRAVIIEGHRHMVNLTDPDRVNRELRAWLELPLDAESVP
ncbi:alpha/beta fold hydrolase [Mesobacterium pallidum]|uniref:alpha/beta fold hydrolase n=1 Tax=Mesobacterium pallidum TaxID=2872037 RepID=UPI001EE218B1|nr:alpha/beta hydrolase [Mesobacterium pallidum]